MLKNFVKDADLKKFYPNLNNQLWGNQQSYQVQIDKSFDMLLNELYTRKIEPRLCMLPLDLKKNNSSSTHEGLARVTETVQTAGEAFLTGWQRRFVVAASAMSGTAWVVKLQGSNKIEQPPAEDNSWVDVHGGGVTIGTTGEYSIVTTDQYRWVRTLSIPNGEGASLTYSAYCVDTMWDDIICYGAFVLIFTDFMLEVNDVWDIRRGQTQRAYNGVLDAVRFPFDADDDGKIDSAETKDHEATMRLVR